MGKVVFGVPAVLVPGLGGIGMSAAGLGGEVAGAAGVETAPSVLYHYTTEEGLQGILDSGEIRASLKSLNASDARYGDGQYLSDISPGSLTGAQLSRAFLGIPFQAQRFTHYVGIDVTGLDLVAGRSGVYVVPNQGALNIFGRIVSSGKN